MRKIFFVNLFLFPLILEAQTFDKMSRSDRCKTAGGQIASHGAPKNTGGVEGNPYGPIDCTCGGKRFNPLSEGDVCRDGKIVTAFENYCEASKGQIIETRSLGVKGPSGQVVKPVVKKCQCGEKEFSPTAKTKCADGKLTP